MKKALKNLAAAALIFCLLTTSLLYASAVEFVASDSKISANAQKGNTELTSVRISASVTEIGDNAFNGCTNLETVIFENEKNILAIGDRAFHGTKWISSLSSCTPDTDCIIINGILVKYLGSAESFRVPDSVHTVNYGAFEKNTAIKELILPRTVKYVLGYAVSECSSLAEIKFEHGANDELIFGDNALRDSALQSISLPESLRAVSQKCFAGCTSLKSVYLPSQLRSIGNRAFSDCSALTEINSAEGKNRLPDSLKQIEYMAFNGCSALTEITLGRGALILDDLIFSDCHSLMTINAYDNMMTVGNYAFGIRLEGKDSQTYIPSRIEGITVNILPSEAKYIMRNQIKLIKYCNHPDGGHSLLSPITYTLKKDALSSPYMLGDIDQNGKLTAADARKLLRAAATLEDFNDLELGDINMDGQIKASDARLLLRLAAKLDTYNEVLI